VTCTDDDSGVFGTVSYAIVSGNGDGYFNITTTGGNGEIKLANTFDYDDFALPARSYQVNVFTLLYFKHILLSYKTRQMDKTQVVNL